MKKYIDIKIRKFKINKLTLNDRNILIIENKSTKYCKVYYNTLHQTL